MFRDGQRLHGLRHPVWDPWSCHLGSWTWLHGPLDAWSWPCSYWRGASASSDAPVGIPGVIISPDRAHTRGNLATSTGWNPSPRVAPQITPSEPAAPRVCARFPTQPVARELSTLRVCVRSQTHVSQKTADVSHQGSATPWGPIPAWQCDLHSGTLTAQWWSASSFEMSGRVRGQRRVL